MTLSRSASVAGVRNGRTRRLNRVLPSSNSELVARSAEAVQAHQQSLDCEQFAGVEGKVP